MAAPEFGKQIKFFNVKEFRHPEIMEEAFLLFLDQARNLSGVSFKLNSDGRSKEENVVASGYGKRSAHLIGRAVDIDIKLNDFAIHFNIVKSLGLEIVNEPSDSHIHVDLGGVFPDGYVIPRPWIALRGD